MDAADKGSSDKDFSGASSEAASRSAAAGAGDAAAAGDKAPGGGAARPGSSLILIPPMTRSGEGARAGEANMGHDAAAGSFAGQRAAKPRLSKESLMRYGVPAALGFCLFGAGIATGGQFFGATAAIHSAVGGAKTVQIAGDQTELRHLGNEIHALQMRVNVLHAVQAAPADIREMQKSLKELRAGLDEMKAETGTSIAQLTVRIDHLQQDEARLQQTNMQFGRTGHEGSTTVATVRPGVGHGPAAMKPTDEAALPSINVPKKKPQLLVDWVVRDVYRGVALVDGPAGMLEVARGDPLPGAGTVESIERRNGGWVLITSRGIVNSVRE